MSTPSTFDQLLTTPSVILEACQRIRQDLDEPTLDAKFNNNYITRMNLIPALTECINLINLQSDNSVILRMTIPIVAGTEYYQLPPCIGTIVRLAVLSSEGYVYTDWVPRGDFCPGGAGWVLEGNTIAFRPTPQQTTSDYSIWYIPGGDIQLHLSFSGAINASDDADVFRLATTLSGNDLGSIDKRENAYCGQVLRIFTTNEVIERIIDEHYFDTDNLWKVHTRTPLPTLAAGTYTYEIVPFVAGHLWVMASRKAAIELATSRNVPDTLMRRLFIQYDFAKKAVLDNLSNLQGRTGKYFQTDTIDNPRARYSWLNQLKP